MKAAALNFLVCPTCQVELSLVATAWDGDEIETGSLRCIGCSKEFPIVRGVPRFVASDEYAASFGRQWNWFRTVQIDSLNGSRQSETTLRETTGWTHADFAGKRILDAGAGAGRFAEVVSRLGGEIIALDLSRAVDATYATLGKRAGVHVVQADLMAAPIRPNSFDLAYSIGVLHHTPDYHAAFVRVAHLVKPGGQLAVYVYPDYTVGRGASDLYRRITTRLPARIMWYLAAIAIPLYYFHKAPLLNRVLPSILPISMHPAWRWRWLDTFDWYTPKYQWKLSYPDVYRGFREAGFDEIELFSAPIRMRGTKRAASPASDTG